MTACLKKIGRMIRLPLGNIILLESLPDYSDNTKAVFDELIKREINKKYKIVWIAFGDKPLPENMRFKNVSWIKRSDIPRYFYYTHRAKCIMCGNIYITKISNKQYFLFLAHGAAFKNSRNKYGVPKNCVNDDVLSLSEYLAHYDSINLSCNEESILPYGYPRNDILLKSNVDINAVFSDIEFNKLIYWLPTYRQDKWGISNSSISIPIIHEKELALKVNECAKKNNVLIVVKPHPAQVISLSNMNLTNIVFINNDFLTEKGVNNYELLGASDAMLSDYSSVYYDYLLTDKPIGLCWEDFEEYNRNEGFTVDPEYAMSGGEKIYTAEDLCLFIERIANGEDALKSEREKIKSVIHKFPDGKSTERVVDHVMTKLKEM